MKKLILLAIIASAFFSSCQKNNSPAPDANNVPGGINAKSRPVLTTDIYVATDYQLQPNHGDLPQFAAAYWKNGNLVTLPATAGNFTSHAQAVTISGSDIYVVGYDHGTNVSLDVPTVAGLPCIWKNGIEQDMPIPGGHIGAATAIAVSGTDVYVAGYYLTNDAVHSRRAMLWKNGVAKLMAFNNFDSIATGIALDGTDVYLCGNAVFNGITCAVYWKNNIWHPFAGTGVTSRASAITVDARHNYYISGASSGLGCYWKNANITVLTGDDYQAPINSFQELRFPNNLSVNNNNIYVSGVFRNPDPELRNPLDMVYWKNGQENSIHGGGLDTGGPVSIVAIGDNVYTSGRYDDLGGIAYYSINQQSTILQNPNGINLDIEVGGLAVVQH